MINSFLEGLQETAERNNIYGMPVVYKDHYYYVTSPEAKQLQKLKKHLELMDDIINKSIEKGVNEVKLDSMAFDLTQLNQENYFNMNQAICRHMQYSSVARNSFYEFGYDLPESMSKYMIESIWELDQM